MDTDFWLERWQRSEIGFHQSEIHWALKRYWSELADGHAARVLVPLCGKSLDLHWLSRQGHEVVGIELSERAVREFYEESGEQPTRESIDGIRRWRAGNIEIFEGDFFEFRSHTPFERFYDRAALVALPSEMRRYYLKHLRGLVSDEARGLVVTFEYDQSRIDGPPFSVPESEVMACSEFRFKLLERRDVLQEHPAFAQRGLDALDECAWLAMPS